MIERITDATPYADTVGHRARYHLAAGYVRNGDRIVDAACGTGYGAEILLDGSRDSTTYVGIDLERSALPPGSQRVTYGQADLTTTILFDQPFDVFVGFETIEHLHDYTRWVELAQQARRWIIVSAPIVPTKHLNPFHVHDFERGDLERLFTNDDWHHWYTWDQPGELSEVVVMRRTPAP